VNSGAPEEQVVSELGHPSGTIFSGADPGFQVRGGAHLKKLRRAEGGAKIFGVFRVKNHDFTPKKTYFFNFRGAREIFGIFHVKNHDPQYTIIV
jgi:hypothetical protein